MKRRPMRVQTGWLERGVTLVELMVVIALIAVLAAFAGPSVSRTIERAQARSAAREIANTLRKARNQAMSRGEAIRVIIDTAAATDRGAIHIFRGETDGDRSDANWVPPRSCREVSITDWGNTTISDTNDAVYRYDLSRTSGDLTIRGVAPGGETDLCFSPDGRILSMSPAGAVMNGGSPIACNGQNWVLWTSEKGATLGNAHNCGASADDRDVIDVYRIIAPFNGGIKVEQ